MQRYTKRRRLTPRGEAKKLEKKEKKGAGHVGKLLQAERGTYKEGRRRGGYSGSNWGRRA